jgi:hypothetical protein
VAGQSATRIKLLDGADISLGQWRAVFRERAAALGALASGGF